jgi:hypothetical protein
VTDKEIDDFRTSERARMAPMREAARKESFVQGFIAGRFPESGTDAELLGVLPDADAAYKRVMGRRGPA